MLSVWSRVFSFSEIKTVVMDFLPKLESNASEMMIKYDKILLH